MSDKISKNGNNSWNPLNYSQNLCVVSNPSMASNQFESSLTPLNDDPICQSITALDLRSDQLVNDLIANNDNDLQINCNQNLQTVSTGRSADVFSTRNILNCGDFGLHVGSKSEVNGMNGGNRFNGLNGNQSVFNRNAMQMMSNPEPMSTALKGNAKPMQTFNTSSHLCNRFSKPLNELLSNPISNSMTSRLTNSLPKAITNSNPSVIPTPNRFSGSLSSEMSTNGNQSFNPSIIGSKSQQSLPYSQTNTYSALVSTQETNTMANRQMRSIRARNVTQASIEPINKLNYYLDKSYEQFKHLEKERKKIESEMIEVFVGQKISSANNIPIQRLAQNATKIDKIITDMSREHAKVITIIAKMEQLRERELSEAIHNSVQNWVEILRDLQIKRKYEMQRNATNIATIGVANIAAEDPFIDQICKSLKQLLVSIRTVRTALWCASVITLYQN